VPTLAGQRPANGRAEARPHRASRTVDLRRENGAHTVGQALACHWSFYISARICCGLLGFSGIRHGGDSESVYIEFY